MRARFADGIAPATLLAQVASTAPWLAIDETPEPGPRLGALADDDLGWMAIVRAGRRLAATAHPDPDARLDYFALCLASHHATVATYVPTDVDSKIRGHAWRGGPAERLRRQWNLARRAARWQVRGWSARIVDVVGHAPVSGHDGEHLAVAAGALGHLAAAGGSAAADEAAAAIDAELAREAAAFVALCAERGGEIDALRLAATLTHNAGDVDQGISYWPENPALDLWRERFARLAHENVQAYGGAFATAARLYRRLIAAEGHRHYPLRAVRCLRRDPSLLLPIGPLLDAWGATVATSAHLGGGDRCEVVAALADGCRKVPNQIGYFRAIAGMASATSLDRLAARDRDVERALADPEVRRHLRVSREAFESELIARTRTELQAR